MDFRRTHTCGALRKEDVGREVTLSGWVARYRDHGGLIFIDLRDRFGVTQIVFDPTKNRTLHAHAEKVRAEWVLCVKGRVMERRDGMQNSKLLTGAIEIFAEEMEVLSRAETPPFSIVDDEEVHEEIRLRYRYLDLRRGRVAHHLALRHHVSMSVRNFLSKEGFLEITTPFLGRSTPEGARDYLIPSRLHRNHFYALPQSPQLFKQLLMIGGMDRYFQIVPCFRDEDLRSDRQPEFTQIDMEMSFAYAEDVMEIAERLIIHLFKEVIGWDIQTSFLRLSYAECMERFGSDRPDMRFDMELKTLDHLVALSECTIFKEALALQGTVKGFVLKGGASLSRREVDDFATFAHQFGAKGLAWMRWIDGAFVSPLAKFFSPELQKALACAMEMQEGDLLLIVADKRACVNQVLDQLRRKLGHVYQQNNMKKYAFLWVTDFPLFNYNEEEKRLQAEHHPFTAPHPADEELLEKEPLKVRALAYDMVLNGYELGGGSQRIYREILQEKIFTLLGLTPEERKEKFGFFLEALRYGTPPHAGIALGLDRIMMLLLGTENIRDVIAFPKTQKGQDLMMEAPSSVTERQLRELYIKIT